ncbi:CDK5 regulatory subunit-associated protein 2 isoform X3 [Clinocottus analis]|uniref:CDK5 regulatory subunit-associated protein 2 isoform X3 n=1 Tax=Clinocottus analis TaxID=304258 RepID=UPI0035C137F8
MDSVVGADLTLPVDINGSCRLPDSIDAGEYSLDSMTAPSFPDKMSPIKALTMKDYENQITALKKENFNLKLRIYFMEERMQQKCDDSTEDIFKTNIELKVELESMKRDVAEKQELLVSASKALESLAGRESGEPQRVREHAQREMAALRDAFNKRIVDLEQSLRTAEEEVDKMAAIAEQEKLKNINMEKELQALGPPSSFNPVPGPSPVQDLQQALQEKDNIIEQLKISLKNQEAVNHQDKRAHQETDAPSADDVKQLSELIAKKDQQLEALRDELHSGKDKTTPHDQSDVGRMESCNKQLSEELTRVKSTNENLTRTLEETQNQNKTLLGKLEEKENDLNSEKKNALKRDKTIQGLTQVFKEKDKQIAELCHEIEDRDDALAKARDAAHKAQLQKYQGVEEHQTLLMAKQTELAQLQGEHHAKVLEGQKLQRGLGRKEQELADLQQAKDQLEVELEDLQQQKKKGDKALNDLNNQLKKLSGEIGDRESALEQQYQELLDQTKRKLQTHEVTIQRLTCTLSDKEQQLQEYINMVRDLEQSKSPGGNDNVLTKLRHRLKEKEKALEDALDEKFAAIEEKDNEIHQLQLSLREKERDLDRLNNLLSHNEETVNSFDSLIKEKDVELQHLANTLKNLQRAKQDVEDNLNRSLREKDSIISQLQLSLEGKTKDMEEMSESMLNQSQSHTRDLAEQMGQRLKVTEAMLAETVKARERLVADNESAVEGLLATISSKDQLIKESAEHYNRMLSERTQEIQQLRKQLSHRQQELATAEKQSSTTAQEGYLETAELRALLAKKDSIINKLLQRGQERDQFLAEARQKEEPDHVLELRQTIQIMQEKLDEKEALLSRKSSEDNVENILSSKKTVVVLKKELAQKTEALNKALKRENELKMSLAELQSLLSELEGRNDGQAANIESLTATLKTKDEIIDVLHERLGQRADGRTDHTLDRVIVSGMERSLPALPQRERTIIGGDSQQEALPNLVALQQEHDALNKALRAEQQLYSSLVRTVKEQDSAQRLHALQLELTAVQLLRQQLEESIKTNEELRDDLERETHRAKLREGMDPINPQELQSMRHQLEDAQRWNISLQARLGAIQSRGGGVGGDTLSFIGDQTSYMSICVGDGLDDSLSLLSAQELKQKVLEQQDCVSRLQTVNNELQNRLSLLERSGRDAHDSEDKDVAGSSPLKQQLEKPQEMQPVTRSVRTHHSCPDKETQTDIQPGQMVSGKLLDDLSMDSRHGQSREHAQSANNTLDSGERGSRQRNTDAMALKSLLTHCGSTSVLQLREELLRLRSENVKLRGLLKEQTSTECKEKASTDASGNSSDGQADLKRSVETMEAESKGQTQIINPSKEKGEKNSMEVSDGEASVTTELIVSAAERMTSPLTKGQSNSRSTKQHGDGAKSRLPVHVRLRVEAGSSRQYVNSDRLQTDALQHLQLDGVCRPDQQLHKDSTASAQHSTSPSSTLAHTHRTGSPVGSDKGSEGRTTPDHSQANAALFIQLELLHQECQEKESLINKLSEQLADWEELHAQLQEKDRLNRQYVEALQAAESTIAYLTACSLDSQGRFGSHAVQCKGSVLVGSDSAIYSRCMELQKALQEKEELNNQLIELLNMTEAAITTTNSQEKIPGFRDLCLQIEMALQQVNASSTRPSPRGGVGGPEDSMQELQRHTDSLQEALWQQNMLNAELQEKLRAADAAARHDDNDEPDGKCSRRVAAEPRQESDSKERPRGTRSYDDVNSDPEMTNVLMNCLGAAQSAVASLAAHCTQSSSLASARSSHTSPEFQMNLDKLQRALQVKQELGEATKPSSRQAAASPGTNRRLHQGLHSDLCRLYKVFGDHRQRICDLQASVEEERGRGEDSEAHRTVLDAKGLPPSVQVELETLHKALREKRKACKSLEEKLATALTSPETARKALEQEDKGVQVDLQDLGYETSGKSENDREESSSTDLEVVVNPSCSASSLPFRHEQATFSSTENLDSTSSTPYPSSPALSSAKVSLKSLQVYDEYGVSKDPVQLQGQVRELKGQLENQNKLILQMQSLLRRYSLSSDLVANSSDPATGKNQEGTRREDRTQDGSHRSGQLRENKEGENLATKDKPSSLNLELELERERTLNRSMSEQLQQTRSRSTSPARLDSLVQSQARELSQLRQQMKESRRLGALQRRQLEELSKAFKELLQAGQVDYYMGEAVREQLDKSLSILDKLEGRLDKALEQEDKGVQVDLQDLGYETSGKSENDREESSSTDLEVVVNPSCSASSLPFRHEQATFSSTENLDSTSSTPYPSSPALSSAKVSLKSLQVYDEYGVSKDPVQLQGQVRELKGQLENQNKLILQMQSLLRRYSLSSDLVANSSDPATGKNQEGTRREDRTQDGSHRSGQLRENKEGENLATKDKPSSLNLELELERERTLNRSMSEQLQQTRSRSTSPARLDSLVQSQARELSQLRQQMKESRRLGALQRRQLEELSKAFKELLQAGQVDYYMGEAVREQLDKSLSILDKLEGRLDKALEQEDKGVQVDLQDLGYETSGKSENDREESSSTDLEVVVNPSCSASSLPFRHEQATFSSTENLDSTSSTPYPSSPALSSAKVSLKSLQVYDEYGVSKDPVQLQGQVRELKGQLENQNKLILQMQSLLRRYSLSSDLVANSSDPATGKNQEGTRREDRTQDGSHRSGQLRENKEGENLATKDKPSSLNLELELERERTLNRSMSEQLQQTRSRSTSPARLDSLVQSQARELSQLRQQMKESRRLGALQRRQLEELSKAFKELLQAGQVDYYMGEAVREQLDKSLSILDKLEGRLDKGESRLGHEDALALDLSRRLTKELQEKNRLIQSLQSQLRGKGPSSPQGAPSDRTASSCQGSPTAGDPADGQRHLSDWTGRDGAAVGGAAEGVSGHRDAASRLQGLQRLNGRLRDQLRGSEDLNTSLRSELDLHRSIMAQTSSHHQEQDHGHGRDGSGPRTHKRDGDIGSQENAAHQPRSMNSDLLAEHLQDIRMLRQRLEESIQTNDQLREQLEKRLAEVEKDPATNIFIHGNEEQGHLANELRLLWGQNQVLKDQLSLATKDKQREREKLRDALSRRTAKLEQRRRECEALTHENNLLQEKLEHSGQENAQLQESVHRLQCDVKLQTQQLSDSQHLLQSLRVELQVYEKIKTEARTQNEPSEASQEVASGPVDLSELLLEIRQLRLQLERSIQTNTALRQRLEEQLLRGPNRSETININYLLSSPDEGGKSPGREGCDLLRHSFQSHSERAGVLPDEKCGSFSSSSGDSATSAPSRLVPGHRMWANRNGRHILGLIEDYNALRKQISEGRKLSRCMDKQLQEGLHALTQQASDSKAVEQQHLRSLSGSMSTMQHVLEEAGRMLKLVWRVSLPAGDPTGDGGNNQQDELLKNEIARLKSRLSQQERMLSGAVKRLRTSNQLKEGMEKVIIDQLYQTHGVLKKARGNLETHYCSLFGLKDEGSPCRWPVGGAAEPPPEQTTRRAAGSRSESSEDPKSDASLRCSY